MKLLVFLAIFAVIACNVADAIAGDLFKNEVISNAEELIKQAHSAVKKLDSQHRTKEANVIVQEIHQLEKLINQLRAATAGTTAFMLEKQINEVETRLTSQLAKLHHESVDHSHDHDSKYLLEKGRVLTKKLDEAIKKLKASGHSLEASALEKEEVELKKLIVELETAPDGLSSTHIMNKLAALEHRIELEFEKVPQIAKPIDMLDVYYDGVHGTHQKEVLLYRATSLLKRAENAIHQLNSQGKLDDIRTIEKDEALVKKLVAQLHLAKNSADLEHVESELRGAEIRLLHELTRLGLNHFLFSRDLKENLIVQGNGLLNQASKALQQLDKVHNTRVMNFIKREEVLIRKSIRQIEEATNTDNIVHFEHDLRLAELRMSYHLKQAQHPRKDLPDHQQQLKQILSQRAATLAKQAKEIIKKLKAESKNSKEADLIEKNEILVKKLVKEIELIKSGPGMLSIEHQLTDAENRLSQEISKAFQTSHKLTRRSIKECLETQYEHLLSMVDVDKLGPEEEQQLAIILEAIRDFVLDINDQVDSMKPHTKIGFKAQKVLFELLKTSDAMFKSTFKKLEH